MREISEWLLSKVVSSDSSNTVAKKLLEIINTGNDVNTIEWITLFAGVPNEKLRTRRIIRYNLKEKKVRITG